MGPFNPVDFDGKSGDELAAEVFGVAFGEGVSWSLLRRDEKFFEFRDRRLSISFPVTAGYLIALQEVSSVGEAHKFCGKNKITLLDEGGLYFRGVAELPISCSRRPPEATIAGFEGSVASMLTKRGIEIVLGYPSFLFTRLIGQPARESNPSLPDPETTSTLVVRNPPVSA